MCTVSWLYQTEGYVLYFNRDEQKTRARALPPAITSDGKIIKPEDGKSGGTWIGVNHYGLGIGLLNYYEKNRRDNKTPIISRGLLVKDLLNNVNPEEVAAQLQHRDLSVYPPFHLFTITPQASSDLYTWNGSTCIRSTEAEKHIPITTSSYQSEKVCLQRKQAFQSQIGAADNPEALEAYHRSHDPKRGAESVCMLRDDAETVSLTRIHVTPHKVEMTYWEKQPNTYVFSEPTYTQIPRQDP